MPSRSLLVAAGVCFLLACSDSSTGGDGSGAPCEAQRQALLADAKEKAPADRRDNPCSEPIVSGFEGRCADYAACAVSAGSGKGGSSGSSYTPEECMYIAEQIKSYATANTDPLGNRTIPEGRQNNPCANPVPQSVFSACTKLIECKEATGK